MQQSCAETESVNSGGGNRNGIYRAFLALQLQEPSTTVNHIHTLLYSINITHFVYVTSLANLEPPINFKKKKKDLFELWEEAGKPTEKSAQGQKKHVNSTQETPNTLEDSNQALITALLWKLFLI